MKQKFSTWITGLFLLVSFATLAWAVEGTLLASAARTAAAASSTVARIAPVGNLVVTMDVTALAASSVTPTITGIDSDGNTYTVCAGSAISATGVSTLMVGPSLTVATNKCSAIVPDHWRLDVAQSGVGSNTYGAFYSTSP